MDGSTYGGLLIRDGLKTSGDRVADGALTAQLAASETVLRDAWRVRHAAYSSQGYIEPRASGMFVDECDHYPSSKTVVIYKHDAPVATVRVCLYAPQSGISGTDAVPAMDVFHDEITTLLPPFSDDGRPARAVEVMRLARHPDVATEHEPVFALFQMVGYLILLLQADAVISAVRAHHMPFYRRLGFQKVTEPRPYPKLRFLTGLMACLRREGEGIEASMPILRMLSHHDAVYQDFVSGRRVPVLGAERFPSGLGRLFNAVPDPAVQPAVMPRQVPQRRARPLPLAA